MIGFLHSTKARSYHGRAISGALVVIGFSAAMPSTEPRMTGFSEANAPTWCSPIHLQCADRRTCRRPGADQASRVRDGLGRDDKVGVHRLPQNCFRAVDAVA